MAGINYARWDHLDSSSDEESFSPPTPPTSPRRPIRPSSFVQQDRPLPCNEELRAQVLREEEELAAFVQRNPCPSENTMKAWLRNAAHQEGPPDEGSQTFSQLMRHMGWTPKKLGWFDYPSFRVLWESAGRRCPGAFLDQRRAGRELYEQGGRECMQFHYYALHYAMCGDSVLHGINKPLPVYGFASHLGKVWDGIGSWLA
ncbi:unnamed protein product [Symbiodinium necroappetens]|uniref:Uncharacterized protein n=1 Tax=Symbiodinium necroappetens TaxID=1628268 RepID=A0A813CNZ9_9DINO|nr:unnamed protein product [Symbiodinium sp. CCMP2456]CAE7944822.1 unnamed protein product [Symbiodinium necroappetens]